MYVQKENPKENKSRAVANTAAQKKSSVKPDFGFVDNRPKAIQMRKLQEKVNNSHHVAQLRAFQDMANDSQSAIKAAQLQTTADSNPTQPESVQMRQKGASPEEIDAKLSELKKTKQGVTEEDTKKAEKKVVAVADEAYAEGLKKESQFKKKPAGGDYTIEGFRNRVYEDGRQDRKRRETGRESAASASSKAGKDGHAYRTKTTWGASRKFSARIRARTSKNRTKRKPEGTTRDYSIIKTPIKSYKVRE